VDGVDGGTLATAEAGDDDEAVKDVLYARGDV
jgi:hypothetical protein